MGDELRERDGTTKITREIFAGTNDKRQNALLFLENLDKLSSNSKGKHDLRQLLTKARIEGQSITAANSVETRVDVDSLSVGNSSGNLLNDVGSFKEVIENKHFNSESDIDDDFVNNSEKVVNKEDVLININPKKYERAKDQLFLDFFKMYTKRSLKDSEPETHSTKMPN